MLPLQAAPVEPGLLLGVNLLLAALVGYLVYRDATSRRNDNATLWGIGMGVASFLLSLLGMILALVVYYLLVVRE